jgi:2-dehydro-3-deoxygalactonokinase
MTGEFFRLLSQQSILSKSVQDDSHSLNGVFLEGFEAGVTQSINDHLLHNAFLVRTNHLFGKISKDVNYHYLSGLLIGAELKDLASGKIPLAVVANEAMRRYYTSALQLLGCGRVETYDADIALVKGHCKIYNLLQS